MTKMKKCLALFLAVIMMFSSLSVAGFAADINECIYTVETYLMDVSGNYPSTPSQIEEFYTLTGETVVLSPESKEGFTFDSDNSVVEFTALADGSSVGKLYFSRNKYTAAYIYEDLLGTQTEESSVYYGARIPGFEANPSGKPVKQGYNFIMWSLDETERVNVPSVMPAKDINMYPIYEIKTYTYIFDACDGGSFSNGEQTITYEYEYGAIPETPDTPSMPHMEFIDWDNNIPATVTKNMTFTALYNELTYSVIFIDNDEIISTMEGYYYGDVIEEYDIPEGYDAWKLSDGTFAEFPYTVTGNVVFYAAAAPSFYTARFYLDVDDTEPYEEYSILQGDEIDFPADPEKTGFTFIGWDSDITIMPDEDVNFVAEWDVNSYTVNFNTNGGNEIAPVTFDYGEEIIITNKPVKDGFTFTGWDGMPNDGKMPAEDITLTANWKKYVSSDSLNFRTELYKYDNESGEWIIAESVERGETVKARIFIETGFAVGDGQILCFYNDDVFSSETIKGADLITNTSKTSTTGKYRVNGSYATPPKTHNTFEELISNGYITKDFLDNNSPITFTFRFSNFTCHKISGDEWFAEFELTVKEDAVGKGNFFIVSETIANADDGYYAYITLTKGIEGGSSLNNVESLFDWNATTSVEDTPVSTGYGRVIYDANGGKFNSNDSETLVYDAKVGDFIESEIPYKVGYIFDSWETPVPVQMPEDVIETKALWIACNNTPFMISAHYFDFSDGAPVEMTKTLEFEGTTGYSIKVVESMPQMPDKNTEYVLLSNFEFEYNILNSDEENEFNGFVSADGTTVLNIYFMPVIHTVIFDANNGSFADGDSLKFIEVPHGSLASEHQPNTEIYKTGYHFSGWYGLTETTRINSDLTFTADWTANVYNATFDANGGEFEDGNSQFISNFEYNEVIVAPDNYPTKDGFEFIGWTDENGNIYSQGDDMGMMPVDGITFYAVWEEIIYTYKAAFDANNGSFENGTSMVTLFAEEGETIIIPVVCERDGFKFDGWYAEDGIKYEPGMQFIMPAYDVLFTCRWIEIPEETTTEPTTVEPSTTEPTTHPTTESTTTPVTTEPTTVPTTVHSHSPKTVVINASCDKSGEKYQVCNECGEKIGKTTVIPALGHSEGEWQTIIEPTYEKEGKKVKKCTRNGCGKVLEEAVIPMLKPETVDLTIKNPSRTTINYGDSIYLHAIVDLPAGAEVVWEASNSNFTYSLSADGKSCFISPASNGETEFTAKVIDSNGNVISEIRTQKMTSKAGFFQKIIAFFKKLFGLTKVYPEMVSKSFDE